EYNALMGEANAIISGTAMAVLIGVALVILPWVSGIADHIFAKLIITFIGIVVFLFGVGHSRG
ncbi:MAG: hypothetical protein AABW49_01485, partial [Nanoarchaeota archaeon]